MQRRRFLSWLGPASILVLSASVALGAETISLTVDATKTPQKMLRSHEVIPVKPGPLTLYYPKWIPGEHGPNGPITSVTGLKFEGNGKVIPWVRDTLDVFTFHLDIPAGVSELHASFDFIEPDGNSATDVLTVLEWNDVILYPAGVPAEQLSYEAKLILPDGWKFGTPLPIDSQSGSQISFKPISLDLLVDSPVIAGEFYRAVDITPAGEPIHHELDLVADSAIALNLSADNQKQMTNLVAESGKLFGTRHYRDYHFLLTLSDHVAHFGLEHHESSDDRMAAKAFIEDDRFVLTGDLLPHEFTHSWNGKYRRPADLATPNYQKPMQDDLLWVYEGLTQYLGDVLAARSGIWTPEQFRGMLAASAANMDNRPGRTWRSLQDTASAAQVLYGVDGGWDNWRRNTDFYDEGALLWLEVDTTLRSMTGGKKSLNDFVAKFAGLGGNTAPKVVPYTFDDIVAGLNAVVPNDWAAFLRQRLDSNQPHAPLGGIVAGGYRLTYATRPSEWSEKLDAQNGTPDFWYSLGLRVNAVGMLTDVLKEGLADKAGLGPDMQIVAVNGRSFTPPLLSLALHDAEGDGPAIELIVVNSNFYKVVKLDYHGGERYPVLERVAATPALLDGILAPLVKPPQ